MVVGDLAWRGQLGAAWRFDLYSCFFLLEFALLGFGSLILFSNRNRRSPRWLFVSAALIVLGGALYRFNVYLIGFNPGKGWIYFPSLAELMISVGIVAIELLGYQVLVKMVPGAAPHHLRRHRQPRQRSRTTAPNAAAAASRSSWT